MLTFDDLKELWQRFLIEAKPGYAHGDPKPYNYFQKFQSALGKETMVVVDVDIEDIDYSVPILGEAFRINAHECRIALVDTLHEDLNDHGLPLGSQVWPNFVGFDESDFIDLKDIRDFHVGKLVSLRVDIPRIESAQPHYNSKVFQCQDCQALIKLKVGLFDQDREPESKCPDRDCNNYQRWKLIPTKSTHYTNQWIHVQPHREKFNVGSVITIPTNLTHGLVGINAVRNIVIHAVYRFEIFKSYRKAGPSSVFHYLEVHGIEEEVEEALVLTDEDRRFNKELSHRHNIQRLLTKSLCPGILGQDIPKLAIILQAIGAVPLKRIGGARFRPEIHILLIGDTSTAKSDLIEGAVRIHPHAVYGSGEGATGVGLSATVIKDKSTGRYYVVPGLLCLGHGGLVGFDEIGELSPEDIAKSKSGIERGTIVITKAGIHMELKSEVSLIAGGNPPGGKRLDDGPIVPQIKIDPSFLSRMDLTFGIRDKRELERDHQIAGAVLLGLIGKIHDENLNDDLLTEEQLAKYIIQSQEIFPEFPRHLFEKIQEIYALARNSSAYGHLMTTRQMLTYVRLALASARSRFSPRVEEQDVELARDLVSIAMQSLSGADFQPDLDSLDRREPEQEVILKVLKKLDKLNLSDGVNEDELLTTLRKEHELHEEKACRYLMLLKSDRLIRQENQKWYPC